MSKSIYLPQIAILTKATDMTDVDRFFEFKFPDGRDLGHKPGQFAEVSIPGIGEAPFSISSSPTQKGYLEMVIRNVGMVTQMIHQLQIGENIGIRGPYGSCFPMEEIKGKNLLFIAGGIGLVPMRSAINYALDNRGDYGRITILFGSKDPSQRLFIDELSKWDAQEDITYLETVDKGDANWKGNTGVITTLFSQIAQVDPATTKAFVVGPPVMYKFVIIELYKLGFKDSDVIVSLERNMKCGVGKCGHCQINSKYVCQDGPVFTLDSIKELREAI